MFAYFGRTSSTRMPALQEPGTFCFVHCVSLLGTEAPSRVNHSLEVVNNRPRGVPFKMQTNQSRAHTLNHLLDPAHSGPLSTCPNPTAGPGTRQAGTGSMPQSPQKLSPSANPKPAYPASPVLSPGNHSKASFTHFLLAPSVS